MKIVGTQGPHITESPKRAKETGNNSAGFKKVMEEVMNHAKSSTTKSPSILAGVSAQSITSLKPSCLDSINSTVSQVEVMLDRLDFYAEKLADEAIRADDLAPLMGELESDIKALEKIRANHNIPRGLDKIVSDLVVTIGAEIEKFRRGDYL